MCGSQIFLKKFDFGVRVFLCFCTYISERLFKPSFQRGGFACMYDTEKRIELIKKLSFTVAVVITALCIKFRKREQKSQDAEDHV